MNVINLCVALVYNVCLFSDLRLQKQVPLHNLTIVSYDIVRNDIDFFRYDVGHCENIYTHTNSHCLTHTTTSTHANTHIHVYILHT